MKRLLIAVIVLLLLGAGLAALPYWFGLEAEATYQRLAGRLSNTALIQHIETRMERGWLRSRATTRVRLRGLGILITVEDRIEHGPLPVGAGGFDPVLARIHSHIRVQNRDGVLILPPFEAHTVVEMDGGGHARVVAGPFQSRRRTGDVVETSGFAGTVRFRPGLSRMIGSFGMPDLTVSTRAGYFSVRGFEARGDVYDGYSGFSVGELGLGAGTLRFAIALDEPHPLALEGLALRLSLGEQDEILVAALDVKADKVVLDPERPLGPLQLTAAARGLDPVVLSQLRERLTREKRKPGAPFGLPWMELLAPLSRAAPELVVSRLTLGGPDGDLTAKGNVRLDGRRVDLRAAPGRWPDALEGGAQLTLPPALVPALARGQIKLELAALMARGRIPPLPGAAVDKVVDAALAKRLPDWPARHHFIRESGYYRLDVTQRDGRLLVNGEAPPSETPVAPN